jgi:hypothetical protein
MEATNEKTYSNMGLAQKDNHTTYALHLWHGLHRRFSGGRFWPGLGEEASPLPSDTALILMGDWYGSR